MVDCLDRVNKTVGQYKTTCFYIVILEIVMQERTQMVLTIHDIM